MFAFLARFSNRFKWWIVLVWAVLAVTLLMIAPKLSRVGVTDQTQFLPQNTESSTADSLLTKKFNAASQPPPSNGLIVFYDSLGLSQKDTQQAQQLHDWLVSSSAPSVITSVVSVFESDALRSTLISADNTTMLMSVNFSVTSLDPSSTAAITQIRNYIKDNFPGSQIYFSGDAGILNDLYGSVQDTINRTTIVTIILVTILLLIVYRSPVAVLLPLITIGCSYLVALGVLGYLAQGGLKVSTLSEAYLVVIIFGVGTDYCMFIVSRFREELLKSDRIQAQELALRHIGPVIAASALTVVVAFLSLGVSRFEMNQTMGYAMALGVALTLVAGLTLTPALISIFGRFVFWPAHKQVARPPGRFGWHAIGKWVSSYPAFFAVPIVLLLAVPYLAIPKLTLSAGITNQLPENVDSVKGFNLFTSHFPGGEFSPLYLMVRLPAGSVFTQANLQPLQDVASSLAAVPGVSRVDYYAAPAAGLNSLLAQLDAANAGIAKGNPPDASALAAVQALGVTLQALPLQYSGIVQSQNFLQIEGSLPELQSHLTALSTAAPAAVPQLLSQIQTSLTSITKNLGGLVSEFNLVVNTPFTESLQSTYFSSDNTVSKMNVILAGDPYAASATGTVALIRKTAENTIQSSAIKSAASYLGGEAATRTDILNVNNSDFSSVTVLTIIGVLLVIILLLRSFLAPLYMVLTVLLNYGSTLGIATWFFIDVLKKGSLVYLIPLFVFVVLVALGADYNIFLMSRIREESHKGTVKTAVANAVGNTGGVITACGIILAGTFATLITSSLGTVLQIGVAISVGIIIDTFLVRALLVPALATMVGRWGWWPSTLCFTLNKKSDDEIEKGQTAP